jgi:enoyl-CoA hydratase
MYQTILIDVEAHVAHLRINRPDKANSMNELFWEEFPKAMAELDENTAVRAIVISGEGKHFSSGIDVSMLMGMKQIMTSGDIGRAAEKLKKFILRLQNSLSSAENCSKPVIACIHGACIGAGVDLITACDLRYCSEDANFCVKEADMGIIADVGTLQRLPKIVSIGIASELALTARNVSGKEAEQIHLVNKCLPTPEEAIEYAKKIAANIAEKSPLVIRGTKKIILYTRDHNVTDGLDYIATWNASQLMSKDVEIAMMAQMQKQKPTFED